MSGSVLRSALLFSTDNWSAGSSAIVFTMEAKSKINLRSSGLVDTFTVFNADQVNGADYLKASTDQSPVSFKPDYASAREAIVATGADVVCAASRLGKTA